MKLPVYVKNIGLEIARSRAEFELGLEPGSKKFQAAVDEGFKEYIAEYKRSIDPRVEENPSTPQNTDAFEAFKKDFFTGEDSWAAQVRERIPNSDALTLLYRHFRGTVMNLANMILALQMGLESKDFVYKSGDPKERLVQVDANRNLRNEVVAVILAMLLPAFKTLTKSALGAAKKKLDEKSRRDLRDESFRLRVVQKIKQSLGSALSAADLGLVVDEAAKS